MDRPNFFKIFRRKKAVSRNERAGKFAKGVILRNDYAQGLVPRLLLVLIFTACAVALLPPTQRTKETDFKAGEIADRDIIAPFNFQVPLSPEELKIKKAGASLSVPPVYVRDRTIERDLSRDLAVLLDTVTTIVNNDTLAVPAKVQLVSTWLPSVSQNSLKAVLTPNSFKVLNKAAREYQRTIFTQGLIDNAALIRRNNYREITVAEGSKEQMRKVADVFEQGRLDQIIREEALASFGKDRDKAQVFFELVRGYVLPNLTLDVQETNRRREKATTQVQDYFVVSKNERIIGKHDKVTREQEMILRALEDSRATQVTTRTPLTLFNLYAAETARIILFCILFGGFLYVFHRRVYKDFSGVAGVFTVMLLYLVFLAVVVRFSLSPYLIPVPFAAIMLAALYDYRLGLVSAVFAAMLIPLVTPFAANVGFVALLAGAVGVIGIEKMRSRSHVFSMFLHISAAYVVGIVSLELGQADGPRVIISQALSGVANGLFSSAAVMFLLPVFENLFGRTSRFTLLELTDLNKPILKRLNMEAHGTYHHSMLIGNLVDAASTDIGADPLRARVMAYYHDIGKIFKPEYFAENQNGGFNKHEKITPQMSSLILVSHVKDGVELAREEKLPELVIDAIKEHHGTTVMAYFYQKALETDSHSSLKKDDFRYPGPRPRSKESGLLMLADTVEAAVRSLKDPTPAHIRNMVTKLVDSRAQEGELDRSGMTLYDLHLIKEKFISILTGIYHKRIAYPGQEEEEAPSESVVKSV
ncbi:MAG: HDIG domain-containing protein [Candidatus Krumholzibacteria bacterium]|nr:HDIG domain-containing protein [Candidatus Krumholzibacteria bacterium]